MLTYLPVDIYFFFVSTRIILYFTFYPCRFVMFPCVLPPVLGMSEGGMYRVPGTVLGFVHVSLCISIVNIRVTYVFEYGHGSVPT